MDASGAAWLCRRGEVRCCRCAAKDWWMPRKERGTGTAVRLGEAAEFVEGSLAEGVVVVVVAMRGEDVSGMSAILRSKRRKADRRRMTNERCGVSKEDRE